LKNGVAIIPGSQTGANDPFDYRERYIELFTEHYLNISKRSAPLWLFAESAMPSSYYKGWVPDCLSFMASQIPGYEYDIFICYR